MNQRPINDQPSHLGRFVRWLFCRQTQGRVLIGLAALGTLVAAFYLEEDLRGKHAWNSCKRELEAKGMVLDWDKHIPPPVPDDQNFFKAPKMQEWFVGRGGSDLSKRLQSQNANLTSSIGAPTNLIATAEAARAYLAWSDQFKPDFDAIGQALNRPYARIDGDYVQPYNVPIPNFIAVRTMAQMLAQRAHCCFLLDEPEQALAELTLLNDSRRLLEGAPTGKPMTLVAAMINVAVAGLYVDTIDEGFRIKAWEEPQLAALQKQLGPISLTTFVVQAFGSEPAATTHTLETAPRAKLREWFSSNSKSRFGQRMRNLEWALIPRGWIYQNMVWVARIGYQNSQGFEPANDLMLPRKFEDLMRKMNEGVFRGTAKPYNFLAAAAVPNFTKAWQTAAHNQTMVNEAQIACALGRYRLANGSYPDTLDALTPQFIEKIPHDIVGGQPLIYHRTADGKFRLYSIGWDEKDDGGLDLSHAKTGSVDYSKGDWAWKN